MSVLILFRGKEGTNSSEENKKSIFNKNIRLHLV